MIVIQYINENSFRYTNITGIYIYYIIYIYNIYIYISFSLYIYLMSWKFISDDWFHTIFIQQSEIA